MHEDPGMKFELDPPRGVGPLKLGMPRPEANAVLESLRDTDAVSGLDVQGRRVFRPGGLMVSISCLRDRLIAIEFGRPGDRTDCVRFGDIGVFTLPTHSCCDGQSAVGSLVPRAGGGGGYVDSPCRSGVAVSEHGSGGDDGDGGATAVYIEDRAVHEVRHYNNCRPHRGLDLAPPSSTAPSHRARTRRPLRPPRPAPRIAAPASGVNLRPLDADGGIHGVRRVYGWVRWRTAPVFQPDARRKIGQPISVRHRLGSSLSCGPTG